MSTVPAKRRVQSEASTSKGHDDIGLTPKVSDDELSRLEELQAALEWQELAAERRTLRALAVAHTSRRAVLKRIKRFWVITFSNHTTIAYHMRHKEDVQALCYLEDVWVERDQREFRAFTFELHFAPNPFFSDKVLRKRYRYSPPPSLSQAPNADGISQANIDFIWDRDIKCSVTPIKWRDPSKSLTKLYPRTYDKETGRVAKVGSFFQMFECDDKEIDLASIIVNELFHDAINYFFNKGEHSGIEPVDEEGWEDSDNDHISSEVD